jgi:hypothetical protein
MPQTLKEMQDHIIAGNHIPLIADHELLGAPKGRMFHAGLDYESGLQLRALFYMDPTEGELIAKLNAGSLDEVSVAFLSKQFLCSECGWDYFQFGTSENIWERTCANGHKIGHDGVHGEMVGLNQFIELSLVARGAADKPKIVGKSQARLAPEAVQRLAANGFETDDLVVQASLGKKDDTMDLTAALTQVSALSTEKGQLQAQLTAAEGTRDAAQTEVTRLSGELNTAQADVTRLTAELAAKPEAEVSDERDAAVAALQGQVTALSVAAGKEAPTGDAMPSKVAELTAKITELTEGLTAILPAPGGTSKPAGAEGGEDAKLAFNPAAFATRK